MIKTLGIKKQKPQTCELLGLGSLSLSLPVVYDEQLNQNFSDRRLQQRLCTSFFSSEKVSSIVPIRSNKAYEIYEFI